ncbi:ribosome biogenesis protein [Grosmannia clavigera kw1407]|uniref:Ribosome assembly protein 1 n=1 Tax=Grosmannia clavigera (strain kw1407 / UAMH 11150) TaxID=655863 RepID=F0XIZ1_GROCL|nr:ribosome biogenesis protein [Grosmannia clavigera kw1407]EFX02409.1 ribosome biogenesis protein [Grosmannia clavigera kw1407]
MPVVSAEKLAELQQHADNVRNICVLAHVDHGKTSLTDALIATNGIISPKMAGKIRYLDSRPDEQLRGITMESSAISLFFSMMRRPSPDADPVAKEYLINLIDSPGHIDFSSEVSTASRLCDGAVVLVDAVEGVCSQTVTVLRQTWVEKLKPLLVINKMDRLITELRMSPGEAFVHVSKLLEQVNAVLGSFFQGERMEEDLNWRERMDERVAAAKEAHGQTDKPQAVEDEFQEKDDEDIYFAPEKNNVIFSSAIDGWAFTVRQFAVLYEKKLGIKSRLLEKVLWGNFYLDPKTKKVLGPKHLKGRNLKPMFVQLVMEPIWAVYNATIGGEHGKGDAEALEKITKSLNITIPPHIKRSRDPRLLLTTVFAAWLPLSTALLVSVVESLPSPRTAQEGRMADLLDRTPDPDHISADIRSALTSFSQAKSQPVVVYVSKMVSVPESELPENKRHGGTLSPDEARELARRKRAEISRAQQAAAAAEVAAGGVFPTADDERYITSALDSATLEDSDAAGQPEERQDDPEHLIGFARIYSGTLSVGDEVYVLAPKFSPARPHQPPEPQKITVQALYMLMGRNLERLDHVPAGVVFGIRGLEGTGVLKSATLCSQLEGACNLAGIASTSGKPIVRVALEPENPADLDKMIAGLKLLVQSDPCAEYEQFSNGEHVLLTAGELHLERCLTDLRERFAHCEIQAGAPIVPYRETIVRADEMRPPANKELGRGAVQSTTSSKQVSILLRVRPLPAEVIDFLVKNTISIQQAFLKGGDADEAKDGGDNDGNDDNDESGVKMLPPDEFRAQLRARFDSCKGRETWKGLIDKIVAFGPRRTGSNVLIDATTAQSLQKVISGERAADETVSPSHFGDKITYAFQLATAQGPLCHEPVQGIAVIVEDVSVTPPSESGAAPLLARDNLGRLTGEVIKTVQQSIHKGFLDWSPRIMLAMYSCEIQASTEVLGRVYDVLTRRRGRVLSETMKEGTPFFTILSLLPVAESFGFSDDMRKRTSGAAQPQLIFAGFEVLDEDPFWVPFTEDDLEDLGEYGDRENVAKRYMDGVRRRKGLLVEGRNVAIDAEKQKTLKR